MFSPDPPPPFEEEFSLTRALASWVSVLFIVFTLVPVLGVSALFISGPLTEPKTIVIARGTSVAEIGKQLEHENAVHMAFVFRIAARLVGPLKAGEYALPAESSAFEIASIMNRGLSVPRMFTAAEGLTSSEIVALLNNDPVLTGAILDVPAEGTLLPETYRYSYGDSRAGILARMQTAMREKINELWAKREDGLPLYSPNDAVVLASIVEKETAKASERSRIAGVFFNRLRKNMRLQSDPTVIYALTNGQRELDRALTHNDLAFVSPMNTYTSDGLPPKPICNPGHDALEAVMRPEHHDFLYFVADGRGGHAFAPDLVTHNRNVALWRRTTENAAIKP
ncbi:MAG: endolytic transglycosylase MltG [Bdellovibrionales bacterium]